MSFKPNSKSTRLPSNTSRPSPPRIHPPLWLCGCVAVLEGAAKSGQKRRKGEAVGKNGIFSKLKTRAPEQKRRKKQKHFFFVRLGKWLKKSVWKRAGQKENGKRREKKLSLALGPGARQKGSSRCRESTWSASRLYSPRRLGLEKEEKSAREFFCGRFIFFVVVVSKESIHKKKEKISPTFSTRNRLKRVRVAGQKCGPTSWKIAGRDGRFLSEH